MKDPFILCRVEAVNWKQKVNQWWEDAIVWDKLRGCIAEAGWWDNFEYVSTYGIENFRQANSLNVEISAAAGWRIENRTFSSQRGKDALLHYLSIDVTDAGFSLRLGSVMRIADDWRRTWVDHLIQGVICIHRSYADHAWLGTPLCVEVRGVEYARPYPARLDPQFGASVLVDFLSLPYHQQRDPLCGQGVRKLLATPVPCGAKRIEDNGLVVLRWVSDLTDEKMLAQRLSLREKWINRILQPPPAPFYNEYGDREILFFGAELNPFLTFYDRRAAVGYKTIYVNPDGSVDEIEFKRLESFLKDHRLPDGSPLENLYLIAPDRDRTIKIHDAARAIGAAAVYYPSEDGSKWFDPFPPGLWMTNNDK